MNDIRIGNNDTCFIHKFYCMVVLGEKIVQVINRDK